MLQPVNFVSHHLSNSGQNGVHIFVDSSILVFDGLSRFYPRCLLENSATLFTNLATTATLGWWDIDLIPC